MRELEWSLCALFGVTPSLVSAAGLLLVAQWENDVHGAGTEHMAVVGSDVYSSKGSVRTGNSYPIEETPCLWGFAGWHQIHSSEIYSTDQYPLLKFVLMPVLEY